MTPPGGRSAPQHVLKVVCEGARDRAFFEAAKAFLPPSLEIHPQRGFKRDAADGLQGVAAQIHHFADAGLRVVGICDLDTLDPKDRIAALIADAKKRAPEVTFEAPVFERGERVARIKAKGSNAEVDVVFVLVTLKNESIGPFRFPTTTLDDYVLRLLVDEAVFGAFAESERLVISSHVDAMKKLDELRDLLAANNAPIADAKRAVAALAAAIGFMSSPADLAERLIRRGDRIVVEKLLQPLLDDCRLAMR